MIWVSQYYRVKGVIPLHSDEQTPPDIPEQSDVSTNTQQKTHTPQSPRTRSIHQPLVESNYEQNIYPKTQRTGIKRAGRTLKVAGISPLPDSLAISRSLRLLRKRRIEGQSMRLNEIETAQQTAYAGGHVVPIFHPTSVRLLSIELVIDATPSMSIWRETILEFRTLLLRSGAFRQIRTWTLDTHIDTVTLHAGINITSPRNPNEVSDVSGRHVILLFSDCVAPAWIAGDVQNLCIRWGRTNPLALIQMLPIHLWKRSIIGSAAKTVITGRDLGIANRYLQAQQPDDWADDNDQPDSIAIPVLTLNANALKHWAMVLAGKSKARTTGVWFQESTHELGTEYRNTLSLQSDRKYPTAEQRVQRFLNTATVATRSLAKKLAFVPVTLPIIRLLQVALVPESGLGEVAEFMLSGLIRIVEPNDNPEYTIYDFHPRVRHILQQSESYLNASEVVGFLSLNERVIRAISQKLIEKTGSTREISAVASDLSAMARSVTIPKQAFARIKLKWLGIRTYDPKDTYRSYFYIPRPEIEKKIDVWLNQSNPKYRSYTIEAPAGQGKTEIIKYLHFKKYYRSKKIYTILISVKELIDLENTIKLFQEMNSVYPEDIILELGYRIYKSLDSIMTNSTLIDKPKTLKPLRVLFDELCNEIHKKLTDGFPRFVFLVDGYEEIDEYSRYLEERYPKLRKNSLLSMIEQYIIEPSIKYPFIYLVTTRRTRSNTRWKSFLIRRLTENKSIDIPLWNLVDVTRQFEVLNNDNFVNISKFIQIQNSIKIYDWSNPRVNRLIIEDALERVQKLSIDKITFSITFTILIWYWFFSIRI